MLKKNSREISARFRHLKQLHNIVVGETGVVLGFDDDRVSANFGFTAVCVERSIRNRKEMLKPFVEIATPSRPIYPAPVQTIPVLHRYNCTAIIYIAPRRFGCITAVYRAYVMRELWAHGFYVYNRYYYYYVIIVRVVNLTSVD